MKMQIEKNGFLGIDQGINYQSEYSSAKAVIIPFPLEKHVSYGEGAKHGPHAILRASHELNENDEQTGAPVYKCGIATLKSPHKLSDTKKALETLSSTVEKVARDRKFPVILGGEHTITYGALMGICKNFQDVSVLHFDAHADLREQYRGSKFSHASALRLVMDNLPVKNLVQVGIRSVSEIDDELGMMKREKKRIKTFWGWQTPSAHAVADALKSKNVYITFDVDAFDMSIMPSTGTPEPGGLNWWQTIEILSAVFAKKHVVGADVVELAPIPNFNGPDFLVARLVYKMIGFKFFK